MVVCLLLRRLLVIASRISTPFREGIRSDMDGRITSVYITQYTKAIPMLRK